MSNPVTNYKCPACTGPLHFAGQSGRLECEYCGSSYDVREMEELYAKEEAAAAAAQAEAESQEEKAWDVEAAGGEWGEDGERMRAWTCPSCGAQLLCEETTAATSCPYCGNPAVVPGQFAGVRKPDYILPFKLTKENAMAALKEHYKGKFLLPKAFVEENHIREIKGVYVPFWLFDSQAEVDMTFHATNSDTHREGDYLVTNTRHYEVRRSGRIGFERVPVDGSSKMSDDFMDSIEPYDYKELKPFSTAYLPGFLADKYDVDADAASRRADSRCTNTALSSVRNTVIGYETVTVKSQRVDLQRGKVKYAILPIWMLSTQWNGKHYLFAMNGQTGKMVGDLPADGKKLWTAFFCLAAGASVLLSLFFSGPLGRFVGGLFS